MRCERSLTGGEERASAGGPQRQPIVYCLVPAEIADRLHDPLRRHFRGDPGVEVVVEQRRHERRSGAERRAEEGDPPAGTERRRIRSTTGRRVSERRAAQVEAALQPPELPRRARRFADQLSFVERLEPSTQEAEDVDTARIVTSFQAGGNGDAFTTIYRRYFDRVYDYLRLLLRDSHEAEDVTQQVFTSVFESLARYERRSQPFRAWLFTIVRNQGLSALRRRGKLQVVDPVELSEEREAAEAEPDDVHALNWITDRDLVIFIERLPVTQRQVLLLRYLFEMSSAEVGTVLDLTPSQVRAIQSRSLRFLRQRLAAIGREPKAGRRTRMRERPRQALILRRRRFALLRR